MGRQEKKIACSPENLWALAATYAKSGKNLCAGKNKKTEFLPGTTRKSAAKPGGKIGVLKRGGDLAHENSGITEQRQETVEQHSFETLRRAADSPQRSAANRSACW